VCPYRAAAPARLRAQTSVMYSGLGMLSSVLCRKRRANSLPVAHSAAPGHSRHELGSARAPAEASLPKNCKPVQSCDCTKTRHQVPLSRPWLQHHVVGSPFCYPVVFVSLLSSSLVASTLSVPSRYVCLCRILLRAQQWLVRHNKHSIGALPHAEGG